MKKIFGVAAILLVCIAFIGLGIQNKELRDKNKEKDQTIVNLEQQINSAVEDDTYLSLCFRTYGEYYKEETGEITFYAEPTCETKLEDVRFISRDVDYKDLGNGSYVYCMRMDNGKICYSKEYPRLIDEEFYNKYYK